MGTCSEPDTAGAGPGVKVTRQSQSVILAGQRPAVAGPPPRPREQREGTPAAQVWKRPLILSLIGGGPSSL